ncbi:carboxyl transferase domain-containing protein [Suillus placidus]|uniref:Carboxyl transferase domain-containing protein n=1 Tax=Suillus placidus TaxID=48579 RepID=A0A9P6ZLR3_9AGAM|nr:carboxyl transferase domain-containing protein [Suillus placidus]
MSILNHNLGDTATMHGNALIFEATLPGFLSLSGMPTFDVDFAGYLSLGLHNQTTIYPLYLKEQLALFAYVLAPMVHNSSYEVVPSNELHETTAPFLNLLWVKGRTGSDNVLHGVYDYVGMAQPHEPPTIIHFALFPSGYRHTAESIDGSESILQTTWVDSSVIASAVGSSGRQICPKKIKAEHSLHKIMAVCTNWGKALAYLCVYMRIAICCGHSDNPHLLTNVEYAERRLEFIQALWPQALECANVAPHDLELVLTKDTKLLMSHHEVLALASPWITQFLYDTRRVITYSMDDHRIFGLGNFFGLALKHSIETLLRMFTRPQAHLLPISLNGFNTFLNHQAATEMVFHIVFRATATNRVRLTMADLEPMIFRSAAYPPAETLALVESCCYQSLLTRLVNMWGANDVMPQYPPVTQVHTELCETVVMLLQQDEDLGIDQFRAGMRRFCILTLMAMQCAVRPMFSVSADQYERDEVRPNIVEIYISVFQMMCKHNARENIPLPLSCYHPFNMIDNSSHFLGTEQTETSLISWLLSQERDTLPGSLLVTASVLFGWVDSHDLIALLDYPVHKGDVGWRTGCIERKPKYLCLVLQLPICAKSWNVEVTQLSYTFRKITFGTQKLFLDCPKKLPIVNDSDVVCMKANPLSSLVICDDFRLALPTRDKCNASDKCNAWLLALHGDVRLESGASQMPVGFSQTEEFSHFYDYLPGPDDRFLTLPRLLKTWVDNIAFRAYISACLAESKSSCITNSGNFKAKEHKVLGVLQSDIHVLGLKKQRAQVEVDMLSDAIARMSEFERTDDGTSSPSTSASHLPENYVGSSNDWLSTSYTSSISSHLRSLFLIKSSGIHPLQHLLLYDSQVASRVPLSDDLMIPKLQVTFFYLTVNEGDLHLQPAHLIGTTYVYDFPELFSKALHNLWIKARATDSSLSSPKSTLEAKELVLDEHDELAEVERAPGNNTFGMVAWVFTLRTPEYPSGHKVVVIANNITYKIGSFGPIEDQFFYTVTKYTREHGLPRVYLSANSGAHNGLGEEVMNIFSCSWNDDEHPEKGIDYIYLNRENYLKVQEKAAALQDHRYYRVESLRGSGLIAGETSRAYDDIFTITLVTARSVGIGAYLVRLGERAVQVEGQPIILTGAPALNKVLGREIMYKNGLLHFTASSDLEGVTHILQWLSYVPESKGDSLPVRETSDYWDRDIAFTPPKGPYDPRWFIEGKEDEYTSQWLTGFFDKRGPSRRHSAGGPRLSLLAVHALVAFPWVSLLSRPGQLSILFLQTLLTQHRLNNKSWRQVKSGTPTLPTKPPRPSSISIVKDSLSSVANWRGFSGGQEDMYDEVLKQGSKIVDELSAYKQPVFIYIVPNGELRGGAWVVLDPSINPEKMEMYADVKARAGVLEPEGIVEIKMRRDKILTLMERLDSMYAELKHASKHTTKTPKERAQATEALADREVFLQPTYKQLDLLYADLHE